MRIYSTLGSEGFECVNLRDPDDYETLLQFDGTPCGNTWKPIRVQRLCPEPRKPCKPSDFPWLGMSPLVMRRTAVDALREILERHGEILPLATDDGVELYVYNTRKVDALDEEHSTIVRFPGSNRIMLIEKAAFVASAIQNLDMFRLPLRAGATYVSDRFVERYRAAGLQGMDFNLSWSG